MKAFVTGASGFAGRRLVERLSAGGAAVTAMVPEGAAPFSDLEEVSTCFGMPELVDPGLPERLQDVDVVFHCDAYFDMQGTAEAFRQANVTGTRLVLDAALSAGVRRFVLLSSQAAGWDGHRLLEAGENPRYPAEYADPYSKSRAEAERLVLGTGRSGRIETVALRPGWIWGPGDTEILPILVRRALKSPLPLVGEGTAPVTTIYVDHLVDALVAAATAPLAKGKAYYVSDDRGLTLREFLDLLLGAVGIVPQYRHIPGTMARAAAAVMQAAAALVGPPSPIIRLLAGMAEAGLTHDVQPARRDLGYRTRVDLDEGLANLTAWAQTLGGVSQLARLRLSRPAPEDG